MALLLRLFTLGSIRSGRLPTTLIADMSIDIAMSFGVLVTAANNQVLGSDCNFVLNFGFAHFMPPRVP